MVPGPEWEPGDPLHHRGTYGYYLFNFRDDTAGGWLDAASWPTPMSSRDLGEGDELAALIAWHHENRQEAS